MSTNQRYFIELAYNGTAYHGWQVQQNAVSVQELLNKALGTILRQPIETTGCGRTDTGVHGKEFFAHFDVEVNSPWSMVDGQSSNHGLSAIDYGQKVRSLNALLPPDISIKNIIP
ncbi:MAG: truA, partial [Mucilaginibacter sp.]|nr:truA [Mucilaginibacter sp.]